MSRRTKKAEKGKDTKAAKPKKTFIRMPKAFNQSIQQIMQQAQARAQQKVQTALELNSDIPKDWMYNLQRGGFAPPTKEGAPDEPKRDDQD